MNFLGLLFISVGLGFVLLLVRLFFHIKKRKNPLRTNFLYVFSAVFGIDLFINWLICIGLGLIQLDPTLDLIALALLSISITISIDIFKSNFKTLV